MSAPVFQKAFTQDIRQKVEARHCGGLMFTGDALSDTISVTMYDDGQPMSLSGSAFGHIRRADGHVVTLDGSITGGNVVGVTLTEDCFGVTGPLTVMLQVVSGDVKTTVLYAIYTVTLGTSSSDTPPDPDASAKYVRYDSTQALTDTQKAQARNNIGAANEEDVTELETALDNKQDALTFDNVPTENSANPVKSGGVFAALAEKADVDGTYPDMSVGRADNADQLISTVPIIDKTPYVFRTSGGSNDIGNRETDRLVGGTIAWNQLASLNAADWHKANCSLSADGQTISMTKTTAVTTANWAYIKNPVPGHKYLMMCEMALAASGTGMARFGLYAAAGSSVTSIDTDSTEFVRAQCVVAVTAANQILGMRRANGAAQNSVAYYRNVMIFDLTRMFGAAIADYVYALDTATAGAGAAWFRRLFPANYYAYDVGTLMSVKTSAHVTVGFNAYDHAAGAAKVLAGHEYQITGAYTVLALNGAAVTPDADGYFTPDTTGPLTVTGGDEATTCVHLTWDGERDGQFEPYEAHTYPLDGELTLRGAPLLDANGGLYYDGDTYESSGAVTRRYGVIADLGALTWSADSSHPTFRASVPATENMKLGGKLVCVRYTGEQHTNYETFWTNAPDRSISATNSQAILILHVKDSAYVSGDVADVEAFAASLSGVALVYELYEPAAETADAYANPQVVDDFGTEEYVDARSIPIPVGHETAYTANLRAKLEMAPNSPDGDGDYIVRQTNGVNEYAPVTHTVQDVQVNGTSVVEDGVANVPMADMQGNPGAIKMIAGNGVGLSGQGNIMIIGAISAAIKNGTNTLTPIVPSGQHESTFYGLAKAAGDTSQSGSSNPVGTYTDAAKDAIQQMLGVIDMIAPHETAAVASQPYAQGACFMWQGKLWRAKAAISTADSITPGTNCEQTTLMAEITR